MHAKIFLASFSIMSMTLQPLAQAKEQANWSAQALKEFVKTTQDSNGQPVSLGKFWEKSYKSMTLSEQIKLKPAVEILKNIKLPSAEVITINGNKGNQSARLLITVAGKTVTVEFLGSQEKYVRVNGVVLSYEDTLSFEKFMSKVSLDSAFVADRNLNLDFAMKKPHLVSLEEYKKMTPEQRAILLIRLREVSEAAEEVLQISREKQKGKKTVQYFFTQSLMSSADAQTKSEIRAAVGKPCLVAGYVGEIVTTGSRTYCNPASAIKAFEERTGIKSTCSSGTHGCNPISFPKSGGICEKPGRGNDSYQQFTKLCGDASPIKTAAEQAELVKAYVKKKEGKDLSFGLKDGKVDNEEEYNKYIKPYMDEHNKLNEEAYNNVCSSANFSTVSKIDRKLQSACDTLKDRKIALELFKAESVGTTPPVATTPPGPADGPGSPCHTDDFKGDKAKDAPNGIRDANKKCIATAVPAPGAAGSTAGMTREECDKQNGTYVIDDKTGEKVCRTREAAVAPVAAGRTRTEPGWFERNKNLIFGLGAGLLVFLGIRWATRSSGSGSSGNYNPPAPPPLPPVPPPVVPPVVPPIEGGTGTGGAPAGGQR
jgi:hypothetical protein